MSVGALLGRLASEKPVGESGGGESEKLLNKKQPDLCRRRENFQRSSRSSSQPASQHVCVTSDWLMLPWVGCTSLNDTRLHFERNLFLGFSSAVGAWSNGGGRPSKDANVHGKLQATLLEHSC